MENYGMYKTLVNENYQTIFTKDLNKNNINDHYNMILNIIKDCIEQDEFKRAVVNVVFTDNIDVDLCIVDYLYNLTFWALPLWIDNKLSSYYLFYSEDIHSSDIKAYIDNKFVEDNRNKIDNKTINNLIYDCLHKLKPVDEFSEYLANTSCLEDSIKLMNENKEIYDIIHLDISDVPLDKVKEKGMEATYRFKEIIENSDHCQRDYFRSGEGLNIKQVKEATINEGTKPSGSGKAYPYAINKNLLTGLGKDPVSWFIEESIGRSAQLIIHDNVSDSGSFARLLGLNNLDSYLCDDPSYVCNTENPLNITIDSLDMFKLFQTGRYFQFTPNGIEYKISKKGIFETSTVAKRRLPIENLIGTPIYLRSPMTCSSLSDEIGVCYKCYGDLAYTNRDINIGKIAAEEETSQVTQKMLSAKHILEGDLEQIEFNTFFKDYFELDRNILKLRTDIDIRNTKLIIDASKIELEDYSAESAINSSSLEYVTKIHIKNDNGEEIPIYSKSKNNKLYITSELNYLIRYKSKKIDKSKLYINGKDLADAPLFSIEIANKDISTILYGITKTINGPASIKNKTKEEWLTDLLHTMIKGKLHVSSIHAEMILANQLRNPDNIFKKPSWQYPNEPYKMLTLHQALSENPSVTISLSYQGIALQLYNPLTYRKSAPSFMDLFFMKKPQDYINNSHIINSSKSDIEQKDKKIERVKLFVPSDK